MTQLEYSLPPYQLVAIQVDPADLLLDPGNPRLKRDEKQSRSYNEVELANVDLQDRLRAALLCKEHDVKRLIDSIGEAGFLDIDSIFVKRLPTIKKYLVLEGNRRTTAIKTLLLDAARLKPAVRQSLARIPVKELICDDPTVWSRTTDLILSIRHMFGVKEWAPMQKAHNVHLTYERELKSRQVDEGVRYDAEALKSVERSMNLSPKEVRNAISIFSLYRSLRNEGYEANSDHYTILEMCVQRPKMAEDVFGYDSREWTISKKGMSVFSDLFLEQGCPINNPAQVRSLYTVWKTSGKSVVMDIASGGRTLDEGVEAVDSAGGAIGQLEAALAILKRIRASALSYSANERKIAREIREFIDQKVLKGQIR